MRNAFVLAAIVSSFFTCAVACSRVEEPDPVRKDPAAVPSPSAVTLPAASSLAPMPAKNVPIESITGTPGRLEKVDLTVGTGKEVKSGSRVKVHYTGKLTDGTQFDSSVGRAPFELTVGAGEVIKGWDQGLVGMKVGGKRKLTIPYDLAYGIAGRPPTIPPKATLVFDIEVVSVE